MLLSRNIGRACCGILALFCGAMCVVALGEYAFGVAVLRGVGAGCWLYLAKVS